MLFRSIEALNPKFKVNIVGKEWSELINSKNVPKEAMVLSAWAPDYADPDNFVSTFYASNGYYGPRLNANDAQLDTWIKEARGTTDTLGSLIFRELKQGGRYIVHDPKTGGTDTPVTVRRFKDRPDQGLYAKQTLVDGFQYIETRDGTQLSAYVTFPRPAEEGPFPTVVSYSGYETVRDTFRVEAAARYR